MNRPVFTYPTVFAKNCFSGGGGVPEKIFGPKHYEKENHLQSVNVVISDRKLSIEDPNNLGTVAYYTPNVISHTDTYPFGQKIALRSDAGSTYRYGFQNQEIDNEVRGNGNNVNFRFRMHDPRLGRFFAVDPLTAQYPHYSPYSFSGNKVIAYAELEGLEEIDSKELSKRKDQILIKLKNADINNENQAGREDLERSINIFLENGRFISAYSIIRWAEGAGGVDVYDFNLLKNYSMFEAGYDDAMEIIGRRANLYLNKNSGESEFTEYSYRGTTLKTMLSDFGTTFGSYGLKYNVKMSKVNVNGEDIIKGIVYFTFVDTYRWDPTRHASYGFIAGDHQELLGLEQLGPKEFSIRSYFISEFTYQNAFFRFNRMEYTEPSDLTNSYEDEKHPEISRGKGYELILGGEQNDFRLLNKEMLDLLNND